MRLAALALVLAVASPALARPAPPRADRTHAKVTVHAPKAKVIAVRPVQVRPRHVEVRRPAPRYVRYQPMDAYRFQRLLQAMQAQAFGDGRILVLRTALDDNRFSVDQVLAVLDHLTFGSEKMEALRMLAPRLIDPENRFEIVGAFTFDSERRAAASILA